MKATCKTILPSFFLLFFFAFSLPTIYSAPINYLIDWNRTPFLVEGNGTLQKGAYAIGPKNIIFSYEDFLFENSYPKKEVSNYGSSANRITLRTHLDSEAEFYFEFKDYQTQNADYADGVAFNIHGIDNNDKVNV